MSLVTDATSDKSEQPQRPVLLKHVRVKNSVVQRQKQPHMHGILALRKPQCLVLRHDFASPRCPFGFRGAILTC